MTDGHKKPSTVGEHLIEVYSALRGVNDRLDDMHKALEDSGAIMAIQADRMMELTKDVSTIKAQIAPLAALNGRLRTVELWQAGTATKIWLIGVLVGAAVAALVQFGIRYVMTGSLV